MALATATIDYNLADIVGLPHYKGTSVTATTNIDGDTVVDTAGNQIRIGSGKGTIDASGSGSIVVWIPGTGSNPTSWQTYIHVRYRDPMVHGGATTRTFGPYTITASANLADLIQEQEIPADFSSSAFIQQVEAIRDGQLAIAGPVDATVAALAVNTGGVGPLTSAALASTFANKATQTTVEAGRLSVSGVSASIDGALVAPKARDRARTESENIGGRSLFTRPAGFTVNPGFAILTDGRRFTTAYDVAVQANSGGATYYVNHLTGNDTTGTGASGTPWRSVDKAVTAAADNDTIIVQAGGIIWKAYGCTSTITKRLNIKAAPGVVPTFVAADLLTWSATAGQTTVYEAARTNVRKVVDLAGDADGQPYVRVASVAACQALPGSWYQASNGTGLVYVNTFAGVTPDPTKILALLTVSLFACETTGRTSTSRVYMEGINVIGSDKGAYFRSDTTYTMAIALKDCTFLHGGYSGVSAVDATGLYNGLNVLGNVTFYAQRVRVAYACLDGFNYHELSGRRPTYVLELECKAHDCGNQSAYDGTTSIPTSNNASTSHDTIPVIRINGKYHHTYGPVLADTVAGTKSLNLGCDVWTSLAPGSSAFSALTGAEMWVYGGRGWDTPADLYAVSGATLHADKVEADTTGGGGTLDITNAR